MNKQEINEFIEKMEEVGDVWTEEHNIPISSGANVLPSSKYSAATYPNLQRSSIL